MLNKRFVAVFLPALLTAVTVPLRAETPPLTQQSGVIEFAAYTEFAPFSADNAGKAAGVDIALGEALAKELGLTAKFRLVAADESVEDDLRNHVWKGHYLGGGVADAFLHAPSDDNFISRIPEVQVTVPYYAETLVVARDSKKFANELTLEMFISKAVGVQTATLADDYLLTAFGGRLREQVKHYLTMQEATQALLNNEVAGVMGTRSEIEAGLGEARAQYTVAAMATPGLTVNQWSLGIAVKSENTALRDALNNALRKLMADGSLANIFAAHGISYTPAVNPVQATAAATR